MEIEEIVDFAKHKTPEVKLKKQNSQDLQMTSSTTSSLASPGDSGVQLLDSESEITSVMSVSGLGCDIDTIPNLDNDEKTADNKEFNQNNFNHFATSVPNYFDKFEAKCLEKSKKEVLNKSLSEEVFEMEHPIKDSDLMNVSLNSYELLDYTLQNKLATNIDQMHVSMSEEVNENLKVNGQNPEPVVLPIAEDKPEEQIVFRRQRKKKSKSDTPKKRVSFHEDILNSTKIDDIHINHGFITHEPDVSLSFFQRGFVRKPDVVKGRYSWAAEGDAPYYEKTPSDREIKSDLYCQHNTRFSSTSSSSTGSISSSIDEDDETCVKKEPKFMQPKSSCLKKTKHSKKIDTKIVQEETNRKRRSDSNLLDSNIFGSLKNILTFSTSVPLAERGVPEGQEDFAIYSSSHESNRRKSCTNLTFKGFEPIEAQPVPAKTEKPLSANKTNLKLTASEGFYPNYPTNQNLPANVIVCDSNVYEHKGISYSYEYDKFQKSFEQQNKPKSSTVYQMILKEFNFFRKKAKEPEKEAPDDFEIVPSPVPEKSDSIEEVQEVEYKSPKNSISRYASTTKMDWSDNETISDMSENPTGRHLHSPKRRVSKSNHYSLSPFKVAPSESGKSDQEGALVSKSLQNLKPATSKSSLINRFLRNVTLKKMLDAKAQNKQKNCRKYMGLYVKGVKFEYKGRDEVDEALEREILKGMEVAQSSEDVVDKKFGMQLKKEIFRSRMERLIRIFPVRSAYATNGESKPLLLILSDTTLYITGIKLGNSLCNHFVLPYTELNTILIGPSAQTIHLSNYDKDMQCIITTGCGKITGDIVGQLEVAMRRDMSKPRLPAVKHLSMRDMVNLRRAICKQTSVDKEEEYFYYSIVNIQDFNPDIPEVTPLGPNKEGPLMFKTSDTEARWETAYFILKAGVLYMLSSASQRVPMRVFPLINGSCQGAHRVFNCPRPHTFQLIVEGKSLHLAAPDEYVASDWLQCLVHAASGGYNQKEKMLTQSCSLLMTSDHILTVREAFPCTVSSLLPSKNQHQPIKGPQVLSCAAIIDLVAFRLPSAEQSWCVLEFSCREVHECSGDWILYFATNVELENFISTLEVLWTYNNENGDSFPLSTIPESDPLSKKCVDIYTSLKQLWPSNSVHLQFL
ncbi:uncharacterized protein prd1 [Tribolium castaneum]|uniref:PH domain-containing protein n=1 Tax=Tribolium castaneum TaxID=7070 RepID=D6WNN9_TRICA|nr:PREDICTED: uncharacterized protein LOC658725 [Tribolium castaneum]EFA03830.1 hypothetical protein TcasGA2_TC013946 [Tribolium castaneum]|eukprot:XP_008192963.1 PREDICTED: uncharacterized protein LOC658725 [Tribolium castaneum]